MSLVRVRKFMAREWEHARRFPSHKDPNYMPGLKWEWCAYPSTQNPQAPLANI